METNIQGLEIPVGIYDDRNIFEQFIASLAARRSERQARRAFYSDALTTLERERTAAAEEPDELACICICRLTEGFHDRLNSLSVVPVHVEALAVIEVRPSDRSETRIVGPVSSEVSPTDASENPFAETPLAGEPAFCTAADVPESPSPDVDSVEDAMAARARLLQEYEDRAAGLAADTASVLRLSLRRDGRVDLAAELQLRQAACRLRALFAEAAPNRAAEKIRPVLQQALDTLSAFRASEAAGCCPLVDMGLGDGGKHGNGSAAWTALAEAYGHAACAADLWHRAEPHLAASGRLRRAGEFLSVLLAEAELLVCAVERSHVVDDVPAMLAAAIRAAMPAADTGAPAFELCQADSEGAIAALRSDPDARFDLFIMDLEARAEEEATERRNQRRDAATQAVEEFFRERPMLDELTEIDSADQGLLKELLLECRAAGVAESHAGVRRQLAKTNVEFLRSVPDLQRTLRFVDQLREWESKKALPLLAAPAEVDLSEAEIAAIRDEAALFAGGKRLLIIGGTRRLRICEELKSRLGCHEVVWRESTTACTSSKFKPAIQNADLVLVLKNLASHEIVEKAREWTRASGGAFIMLNGGHGVGRIMRDIYEYAAAPSKRVSGIGGVAVCPAVRAVCLSRLDVAKPKEARHVSRNGRK